MEAALIFKDSCHLKEEAGWPSDMQSLHPHTLFFIGEVLEILIAK